MHIETPWGIGAASCLHSAVVGCIYIYNPITTPTACSELVSLQPILIISEDRR